MNSGHPRPDESSLTETPLAFPSAGRLLRTLTRGLLLRCPNCGGGPLNATWFRMREACPRCGLKVERGGSDYFLGSMMFNLIGAEGMFVVGLLAVLIATWPDVPWDFLQFGGPVLMVLFPIAFFPFSKTIWLAFDVAFRPVTPDEVRNKDSVD
jgi:uncharacterized protein (DUF983 family)